MSKIPFGQFLTVDKQIYKICPECRIEILPEWEHAYEYEWCPHCGLNLDIIKKEMEKGSM